MGESTSERQSASFASSEPSLRQQLPESLQKAGSIRQQFETANNNIPANNTLQLDQNDREQGDNDAGSRMVKRQKPFPELKPNDDLSVKRTSFNQEWIQELRAEKVKQFEVQRQIAPQKKQRSEPSFER